MENTVYEYDEISLQEIIGVLWKNKYFIASFLSVGLLLGLIFSGIRIIQDPVEYLYKAKATIELVDEREMSNQPQTMLRVMESSAILEEAMKNLKITNRSYVVRTDNSIKPNYYDVIVEGPDKEIAVNFVNEIVALGRATVKPAIQMGKNTIINNGYIYGNPIVISKGVNVTLNVIISMIFAGMISVFIIFVIRNMSGKIYTKDEVEKILGSKVLATIPNEDENNKYKKFFQVR